MTHLTQSEWGDIASQLGEGDIVTVRFERSEGADPSAMELELTSPYNDSWRGVGTDGRNKWNYTTMWVSPAQYGRHGAVVVLRSVKSNGMYDQTLGVVTDVRVGE